MIVLRTPKGWTGPKIVDGLQQVEGTFRSHQVPLAELATKPEHLKMLEEWMRSVINPKNFLMKTARLSRRLQELSPQRHKRRMGANPHANGGKLLLKDLKMPNFRDYAVEVPKPATTYAEPTRVLGQFLRDVMKLE